VPGHDSTLSALLTETLRSLFAANPGLARNAGDHHYDGVLGPVGHAAIRGRIGELERLRGRLDGVSRVDLDGEQRADLASARQLVIDEHFHLERLRDPQTNPQSVADTGADIWSYVARDYAPVQERAQGLCRHLEQLGEWLETATAELDADLAPGPRSVALDVIRGFASFYRKDVGTALGELGDRALSARLDSALEAGAAACDRFAAALEARGDGADPALGAETFCAMLEAQEGLQETVPSLRERVDAELAELSARAAELASRMGATSLTDAFGQMEAVRTTAERLIPDTAGMLTRLRDFWLERDVVTVPRDTGCRVIPTPSFYDWVTAAYENPGPLNPPGLEHFYFVTPVNPAWPAEQAEQWLSHLNLPCLENISVHEVYPGHFVHCVAALAQPSLMRKVAFFSGFGEGWAHYTELLAVEQGLAEGRPLQELAMLQDALLRVCRFSAAVGMHCEGMSLPDATRLFEEQAHIPRLAAEREALRGTYDPMYLVYTYGKLEILRWRAELSAQPGFSLKRFHDRIIGCGFAPLGAVREHLMADQEAAVQG
jgi:uncharacterized protein (DUF885 family)